MALLDEEDKVSHDPREPLLTPRSMLQLCNALDIEVKLASQVIRDAAKMAAMSWLEPIQGADITPRQRRALLNRLINHPHIQSVLGTSKARELKMRWEAALHMAQQQDGQAV